MLPIIFSLAGTILSEAEKQLFTRSPPRYLFAGYSCDTSLEKNKSPAALQIKISIENLIEK